MCSGCEPRATRNCRVGKGAFFAPCPRGNAGGGHASLCPPYNCNENREDTMTIRKSFIRAALLAATVLTSPAFAADVTPERLLNPDKEPQNWLMNHRTYAGQRFSPL